jgi:hypothetical protein
MKRIILTFFSGILLLGALSGQALRNQGELVVAGDYLVITGNYLNYNSGAVTLDGTISLTGNWTNYASNNVIKSPGTNGEVIFKGSTTQTIGGTASLFDFEKLRISSGSIVDVAAGKGVTAYGACTFDSPLVLKSTTAPFRSQMATFINKGAVSGNISMEMYYSGNASLSAAGGRALFFSSPISNATSTAVGANGTTNRLFYQNEVARTNVEIKTTGVTLTVGKGYFFRGSSNTAYTFTGPPNTNASYNTSGIPMNDAAHFYLMGNPYPAVVDWASISRTNIKGTIWYRSCTAAGSMRVDTWNGSVGTNNNGTAAVDGKIPPMQGFWIQGTTIGQTGSITISESDRGHNWGNAAFLKSGEVTNSEILRLYLYSGENRDETILVQSPDGQDTLDPLDATKMMLGNTSVGELYTVLPTGKRLVIQTVGLVSEEELFPIGFLNTTPDAEFRIEADLSNASARCQYFLEDKKTGTFQNLLLNPAYTFTSDALKDTTGSRFVLHIGQAPMLLTEDTLRVCAPSLADLTDSAVTAGSATGLEYSYWKDADATIPYDYPEQAEAGQYFIKGSTGNGYYSIAGPVNVVVNPKPTVKVNSTFEIGASQTVDLAVSGIAGGTDPNLSFQFFTDPACLIPYTSYANATAGIYYVKATNKNGCSSVGGPINIIMTGAPDNKDSELFIYASGKQIFVEHCAPNSLITIMDVLGRQHYSLVSKSARETITCNVEAGIYIVRVSNSANVQSHKVYLK